MDNVNSLSRIDLHPYNYLGSVTAKGPRSSVALWSIILVRSGAWVPRRAGPTPLHRLAILSPITTVELRVATVARKAASIALHLPAIAMELTVRCALAMVLP